MADDSVQQIIGTVGAAACCCILWGTATLANDRLLNHLERRYYNKPRLSNNNAGNPNASGLASTLANNTSNGLVPITINPDNNNSSSSNNNNNPSRKRSGFEQFAANNSWTKDNRLLFYLLAVACSITYCGFILIMIMASYNPNSSLADIGSIFSVATYLSMIVMVFWTVLEGVETVKRLGMRHWSNSGNNNNNNNNSGKNKSTKNKSAKAITSASNNKSCAKKNKKKGRSESVRRSRGPNEGGADGETDQTASSAAFSMSHPTGSELQGDDEDGEFLNNNTYSDDDDNGTDDDGDESNNPYGADDEDADGFTGGDGFGQNVHNSKNTGMMTTSASMSTRDPNSNTSQQQQQQQYMPSSSGFSSNQQNESFYDDSYGAVVGPEDDDGFGSVAGRNSAYVGGGNNNNNSMGNNAMMIAAGGGGAGGGGNLNQSSFGSASASRVPINSGNSSNGLIGLHSHSSHQHNGGGASSNANTLELESQSSKISNVNYSGANREEEKEESFFFEGCDPWEQRGFLSLISIFCAYIVFVVIDQAYMGTTHKDHSVIQWGSCVVSLLIGLLCIFQAINTFQSFKNTSQELAFLFVSIFGILAFFLLLRSCLVFPPIQHNLGRYLTVAFITSCDAISMLILLLRVPKSK